MAQDLIRPVAQSYLDDAQRFLTKRVGRVVMSPGNLPAWDDCCEGQLYVRVVSVAPVVQSPRPAGSVFCGVLAFQVTLALGVIRCAATMNDQGIPPSAVQVSNDGWQMTQDLADLEQAMLCNDNTHTVIGWQPQGVEGGCHGGEWQFNVRVNTCADCGED